MNYSESMKAKRAINRKKRNEEYARRILISWIVVLIVGLLLGMLAGILIGKASAKCDKQHKVETEIEAPTKVYFFPSEVQETEQIEDEPKKPEPKSLGTFRITAYCSCEKCCGEWAKNRPGGIVKGAAGVELTPGVSAASPLPFGTKLYIEGYGEVVVQDRTAKWVVEKHGENIVDVYFDNHEEACNFGLQYKEVYQIESEEITND